MTARLVSIYKQPDAKGPRTLDFQVDCYSEQRAIKSARIPHAVVKTGNGVLYCRVISEQGDEMIRPLSGCWVSQSRQCYLVTKAQIDVIELVRPGYGGGVSRKITVEDFRKMLLAGSIKVHSIVASSMYRGDARSVGTDADEADLAAFLSRTQGASADRSLMQGLAS